MAMITVLTIFILVDYVACLALLLRKTHVCDKMAKHHPDLIMCRKQPGVAIGRLCEKCKFASFSTGKFIPYLAMMKLFEISWKVEKSLSMLPSTCGVFCMELQIHPPVDAMFPILSAHLSIYQNDNLLLLPP